MSDLSISSEEIYIYSAKLIKIFYFTKFYLKKKCLIKLLKISIFC